MHRLNEQWIQQGLIPQEHRFYVDLPHYGWNRCKHFSKKLPGIARHAGLHDDAGDCELTIVYERMCEEDHTMRNYSLAEMVEKAICGANKQRFQVCFSSAWYQALK